MADQESIHIGPHSHSSQDRQERTTQALRHTPLLVIYAAKPFFLQLLPRLQHTACFFSSGSQLTQTLEQRIVFYRRMSPVDRTPGAEPHIDAVETRVEYGNDPSTCLFCYSSMLAYDIDVPVGRNPRSSPSPASRTTTRTILATTMTPQQSFRVGCRPSRWLLAGKRR